MNDYEKYMAIDEEYSLYMNICEHLWNLSYGIKQYENKGGSLENIKCKILSDVCKYIKGLDNKEKYYRSELNRLAANLLTKQHGIHLGEKIPYNHPGTGQSGFIRVENVEIYMKDEVANTGTFRVSGRRFRKDGTLGKKEQTAYLTFTKPTENND